MSRNNNNLSPNQKLFTAIWNIFVETEIKSNTYQLKLLITRSADVNAVDSEGNSLLHYSLLNGMPDMPYLLVALGANLESLEGSEYSMCFEGFYAQLQSMIDASPDLDFSGPVGALLVTRSHILAQRYVDFCREGQVSNYSDVATVSRVRAECVESLSSRNPVGGMQNLFVNLLYSADLSAEGFVNSLGSLSDLEQMISVVNHWDRPAEVAVSEGLGL